MKYCSSCGAQLQDTDSFCKECGAKAEGTAPAAPSVPYNRNEMAPARQLRTNRSLLKTILLSLITLGIYALVVHSNISEEINEVASKHDGKHTMHFLLANLLLGPITLWIFPIVWTHQLCNRMGNELSRRGIDYTFSAGTFWGWGVLGALIFIGPFVYGHKFYKAMNLINENYNSFG